MDAWIVAGAFLAGWVTCFVGWLISREAGDASPEIDLRDHAAAPTPDRTRP